MPKNIAQQLGSYIKTKANNVIDNAMEYGGSLGSVNLSEAEMRKRKEQVDLINKADKNYKISKMGKPVGTLEILKYVPSVVGDALKKIPKPSRNSDRYNYQQQQKKKNK